jgi:hypothetical protein
MDQQLTRQHEGIAALSGSSMCASMSGRRNQWGRVLTEGKPSFHTPAHPIGIGAVLQKQKDFVAATGRLQGSAILMPDRK